MSSQKRRRLINLSSVAALIFILILITVLFGDTLIDMVKDPDDFRERTDNMGILGRLLFVLLTALQVVLAVLPGQIFTLAGGYCFGVLWGTILTMVGTLIGSAIAFLLSRFLGLRAVTSFYPEEKLQNLSFLRESKKQDLFTLIVFLIPGIPKDMVTYFMGLTQMKLPKFLILSMLGRFPAILITVLGGAAIQTQNIALIIVSIALIAILLLIGSCFYGKRRSLEKENKNSEQQR